MRTLILITALALATACSTTAPAAESAVESAVVFEKPVEPVEEPTAVAEAPVRKEVPRGVPSWEWYGLEGIATLEEMITASPIIVRGRLASVTPVSVRSAFSVSGPLGSQQFDGYHGSLEFTFDVLEYLKGAGGVQVKGIAYGHVLHSVEGYSDTPAEAVEEARSRILGGRDARWDGREAIVFLRRPPPYLAKHLVDQLDYYWLGHVGGDPLSNVQITVMSGEGRAWLPDASPPGNTARSPSEQLFLLEDPGNSGARTVTTKTPTPTDSISLAALKSTITTIEADLAAASDPDAYRECMVATQQWNRSTFTHRLFETATSSGAPAETVVYSYVDSVIASNLRKFGPTEPATGYLDHWFEGRDAHLFGHKYPGHHYALRPLPAGEYRFFDMYRSPEMVICDGDPHAMRGIWDHRLTVTAPTGALAEAFFDPARDGAALSATTTIGTVSWENATVKADLTIKVPASADLDFISSDGSVSLSLAVANATETDGVRSWAVTPQPWADGDQLMLRIRQPAAR